MHERYTTESSSNIPFWFSLLLIVVNFEVDLESIPRKTYKIRPPLLIQVRYGCNYWLSCLSRSKTRPGRTQNCNHYNLLASTMAGNAHPRSAPDQPSSG